MMDEDLIKINTPELEIYLHSDNFVVSTIREWSNSRKVDCISDPKREASPLQTKGAYAEGPLNDKSDCAPSAVASSDINSFALRWDVIHKTLLRCMKKYYTQRFLELTKFNKVSGISYR